ncbi:MAG TPA: HAMP domain-containing sensor histidine kinase [Candidatus Limnocylindria bacterium]|nr:HAMP domain-containing sensor histidine kinase [Candidatus Limnocylindria bacterium]
MTQIIYVLIFISVAARALRHPTTAHTDMALFFGAITFVIVVSRTATFLGITLPSWLTAIEIVIIMALPYMLLRLVDDFTYVRPLVKRAAELGLAGGAVATYATTPTVGTPVVLYVVVYFFVLAIYCGIAFIRAARSSRGVTRRRMEAISLGSILIGTAILVAGLAPLARPDDRTALQALQQLCSLGSGLAYFLGFAPPPILRRAWQEPELRAFLARAASLPRLPTTLDIVRELERGAASSTGTTARIGLWQEDTGALRFWEDDDTVVEIAPGQHFAGRAFELQRQIFSTNPVRDNPDGADGYRARNIGVVLAAPITAGERRLGVLTLSAARPPIFAVSDIELAALLADQAAVILESRALIDHAARVRAREEATRLKEDFLSAAAHDLKTPLTTVVAQAEFLERRATREPSAPADITGIRRVVRESKRLAGLVGDLLDATRLEQGRLVGEREPVDLATLAQEVAAHDQSDPRICQVEVTAPVVGVYDRRRIEQLLQNLIENARKYSPERTPVTVKVWQQDGEARVAVRDSGIGIPAADLPRIFERFSRASNVDDRRFHGMGLGLFICRGIVEEHGGRIWVESEVGKGSTFHVGLPLADGRRLN